MCLGRRLRLCRQVGTEHGAERNQRKCSHVWNPPKSIQTTTVMVAGEVTGTGGCYRIAITHAAATGTGSPFAALQAAGKRHFLEGGAVAALPGIRCPAYAFFTR